MMAVAACAASQLRHNHSLCQQARCSYASKGVAACSPGPVSNGCTSASLVVKVLVLVLLSAAGGAAGATTCCLDSFSVWVRSSANDCCSGILDDDAPQHLCCAACGCGCVKCRLRSLPSEPLRVPAPLLLQLLNCWSDSAVCFMI